MIGIIGGGISGLAVAHFLAESGTDFVLLEADERPGGVMRTHQVDGYPLDTGPQRTRVTGDVRRLIDAAGLGERVLVAPEDFPLHVYRRGRLREVPLDLGTAIRTDLLGWGGKLRVLLEPLKEGPRDDETVARYLTRSFGRQAYERMLGPFYGGLYGSDPARMYVRHGLRMTLDHFGVKGSLLVAFLRRGAQARQAIETVSFEGGMQALPEGLAARHRDRIRLGTRVTAIRRDGSGGSGGQAGEVRADRDGSEAPGAPAPGRTADTPETPGASGASFTPEPPVSSGASGTPTTGGTPGGRRISRGSGGIGDGAGGGFILEVEGGEPVHVDEVVLSLSAPQAAMALADIAPEASERIGRLRYNRLAVVHMLAAGDGEALRGAGYQVAFDEPMETRGVTWNGALFGRGGLCAAYLGGMRHPELVDWDDDRIAEVALREFTAATGLGARVLKVSRTWIPAWDETWDAIADLELPRGIHLCANWNARPGIPGRAAAARRLCGELAKGR